ncbi:YdaS family helix-turn-helix protein [Rhizobium sp. SGZ-381]|uniref:YdaS family helix-turn-helix protein n=1 Tax=Rhizobium sp. SGZ-381 TaxID=3342800 RepID=UPI00366E45F4
MQKVAGYATNCGMETVSPIAAYRDRNDRMSLDAFGALFSPRVNKSTVLRWERRGVPVERVVQIEQVTGISRHSLRPDIFGRYPKEAAE